MSKNQAEVTAVSFGGGGRCGAGRHIPVAEHYRDKNIACWMGTSIGGFIAILIANGFSEQAMKNAMYQLWRPSMRSALHAIAPRLINPFKLLKGTESELQKLSTYFGLLDQTKHIEQWCKGLEWNNAQFGLFDLISRKPIVADKDSGMPLHIALSATMAVPLVFSPVLWIDAEGTRHLLIDGGIAHCHPTVEGRKTAIVKCMTFPGRDWCWPDREGDDIIDIGVMPGLNVLFPPSRREIDKQVDEARTKFGAIKSATRE